MVTQHQGTPQRPLRWEKKREVEREKKRGEGRREGKISGEEEKDE